MICPRLDLDDGSDFGAGFVCRQKEEKDVREGLFALWWVVEAVCLGTLDGTAFLSQPGRTIGRPIYFAVTVASART